MGVEALVPEASIERLNIRIIRRFPGSGKDKFNILPIGAPVHVFGYELGAVIHLYLFGLPSPNKRSPSRISQPGQLLCPGQHGWPCISYNNYRLSLSSVFSCRQRAHQRQPRSSSEANSMLQQSCKWKMTAVPTGGEAARHRRGRLTRRSPLLYKYDRPAYGCPASLPGATAHKYAKGRSGPAFGRYPGSAAVWEDPPGGVPGNTRPRCSAAI